GEGARGGGRGLISYIRRAGGFGIAREKAAAQTQSRCMRKRGSRVPASPCQRKRERLTICVSPDRADDPDTSREDIMLTRRGFAGFASFAICVTYRVHCDRSVGARRATRRDGRDDAEACA